MEYKNTILENDFTINCNGKLLDLSKPIIMGILNITPDSFYDGGKYENELKIIQQVEKMIEEGADIIDIGALSSRPGAKGISPKEEIKRLKPALLKIKKEFKEIIISIDTYSSEIAKMVVNEFGVDIINDISAGNLDKKMFKTIADLQVPYIIMHMQGNPLIMQNDPYYKNVVQDIVRYFTRKVRKLRDLGVNDIIIDPGLGFGKKIEHNYQLLKHLDNFKIFKLPLLVGISRKSFIYKLFNISSQEALNGTTVLHTLALLNGANILRVHDVKEANETIKIVNMIK